MADASTPRGGQGLLLLTVALAAVALQVAAGIEVRIADVMRTNFIDQLPDSKYVVAIRALKEVQALPADADEGSTPIVMSDMRGHKYTCFLPPIDDPDSGADSGASDLGSQALAKAPTQYLKALSSTCFYRVEGWWTYELCYMKKIRQYHQEQDEVVAEFILGEFDATSSERLEEYFMERDPSTEAKYFPQKYSGGTPCDLTSKPRETEVRFTCSTEQTNILTSIKEPSTCSYAITFVTPLICKHPAFRRKAVSAVPIYCNPTEPEPEPEEEAQMDSPSPVDEDSIGQGDTKTFTTKDGDSYRLSYDQGKVTVEVVGGRPQEEASDASAATGGGQGGHEGEDYSEVGDRASGEGNEAGQTAVEEEAALGQARGDVGEEEEEEAPEQSTGQQVEADGEEEEEEMAMLAAHEEQREEEQEEEEVSSPPEEQRRDEL